MPARAGLSSRTLHAALSGRVPAAHARGCMHACSSSEQSCTSSAELVCFVRAGAHVRGEAGPRTEADRRAGRREDALERRRTRPGRAVHAPHRWVRPARLASPRTCGGRGKCPGGCVVQADRSTQLHPARHWLQLGAILRWSGSIKARCLKALRHYRNARHSHTHAALAALLMLACRGHAAGRWRDRVPGRLQRRVPRVGGGRLGAPVHRPPHTVLARLQVRPLPCARQFHAEWPCSVRLALAEAPLYEEIPMAYAFAPCSLLLAAW